MPILRYEITDRLRLLESPILENPPPYCSVIKNIMISFRSSLVITMLRKLNVTNEPSQ